MLSRIRKFLSSLFSIYFFSFWLVTSLVLSLTLFVFYRSTKNSEEKVFKESVSEAKENILYHVRHYNKGLEELYKSHDTSRYYRVMNQLSRLGEDFDTMDLDGIDRISKAENVSIFLVDPSTTKIIASSDRNFLGVNLREVFTTLGPLLDSLKPGEVNIRYSWNPSIARIRAFVRMLSSNKRYIWSMKFRIMTESPLDKSIKFLRNVSKKNSLVSRIGVYSNEGLTNHGLKSLSLPRNLKLALSDKDSSEDFVCEFWQEIKTPKTDGRSNQYIRYVGIEFQNKYLEGTFSDLISHLYEIIAFSVFLSLLTSFFLSTFLTQAIYRVLSVTRELENDIESPIELPKVWNNELNELSFSFMRLLRSLAEKKKKNQEMASQIIHIADKERESISRDLHDSVGQLLVAANFKVSAEDKKGAKEVILLASEELRNIYYRLDPRVLEDTTFQNAVEWYLLKFFPKEFPYKLDLSLADHFPEFSKVQIFKITQEIIANAKKHSPKGRFLNIFLKKKGKGFFLKAENEITKSSQKEKISVGNGLENIRLRVESLGGSLSIKETHKTFEIEINFEI